MPIGVLQAPEYQDTANIISPFAEALKTGLSTVGSIQDIASKNYANQMAAAKAKYAPQFATAELQQAQAQPKLTIAEATYQNALANGVPSEIALRYAQAKQYQADTNKQNILNQYLPQSEQARIKETQAQTNYYNMGGGRGGTGSKDQQMYQYMVGQDNPGLSDDQVREAANVLANGGSQLSDGTRINMMSPMTKMAYDRAIKATSTATLITKGVQANQADAELTALTDHVQPVIKEIGTTYGNKSLDQIEASFSNDPQQQDKLGRIIGSRALQYAIAQLRNRIDMGEPGINATYEIMNNSGQTIDNMAPRITPRARQAAMDFINAGVRKALTARNKVGVGASKASGDQNSGKVRNYNLIKGGFD